MTSFFLISSPSFIAEGKSSTVKSTIGEWREGGGREGGGGGRRRRGGRKVGRGREEGREEGVFFKKAVYCDMAEATFCLFPFSPPHQPWDKASKLLQEHWPQNLIPFSC